MIGAYITIGILAAALALVLFSAIYPKIRKYRIVLKTMDAPKRKRRVTATKKKKKSVWIRVI